MSNSTTLFPGPLCTNELEFVWNMSKFLGKQDIPHSDYQCCSLSQSQTGSSILHKHPGFGGSQELWPQCHLCYQTHGSHIHSHHWLCQGKSDTQDLPVPKGKTPSLLPGKDHEISQALYFHFYPLHSHLPLSTRTSSCQFLSSSIQTFSQAHPYCPYTIPSNQRNKKKWEKNLHLLLVLISRGWEE